MRRRRCINGPGTQQPGATARQRAAGSTRDRPSGSQLTLFSDEPGDGPDANPRRHRRALEPTEPMSADSLISIIAPAFNATAFYDAWLGSIQAQGYPNLEVVLVDDGSTDNLRELAQNGPSFLRYL